MSDGYVCSECGLDYDTISPGDAVVAVRSFPRRFREAFDDVDADVLHRRPDAKTWSAVEYTAHVADIFGVFTETFSRVRADRDAEVAGLWWNADERAAQQRYNDRSPQDALGGLATAAAALADELDKVGASGWKQTAAFPWGERDLLTMARNAVHEGAHHLRDVGKVLSAVS